MAKHIQGLDKLDDAIKKLSQKDAKKAANKAVRAGPAPIRKQAKQNAKKLDDPATAENISQKIAMRSMKSRDAGPHTKGARRGVLGGAKAPATASGASGGAGQANPRGDTYYWRFLA